MALVLTMIVIVLGAYVRLSHAGLGCPDWPGCYGLVDVPRGQQEVSAANQAYPERPVDEAKAWKEMIHRYAAGILWLVIMALAWLGWRRTTPKLSPWLPTGLAVLVTAQAILGMLTVTLLLKPLVVTLHLLGGMATLSLLWWMALKLSRFPVARQRLRISSWALFALAVTIVQVALGGWTSSNYAALACPDFPTCQGQWWPATDFKAGFTLWHGLGVDYEGGILQGPARAAIHLLHRLGALVVAVSVFGLACKALLQTASRTLRGLGCLLVIVLLAQLTLGLLNVLWSLPLPVATAHNAGAALLILLLVTVVHHSIPSRRRTL